MTTDARARWGGVDEGFGGLTGRRARDAGTEGRQGVEKGDDVAVSRRSTASVGELGGGDS